MKWLKLDCWLLPIVLILVMGILFNVGESLPDGPLAKDYINSLSFDGGCSQQAQDFCTMITGLMRLGDFLGGGRFTVQLIWFGPPLLFLLWLAVPKPPLAKTLAEFMPDDPPRGD